MLGKRFVKGCQIVTVHVVLQPVTVDQVIEGIDSDKPHQQLAATQRCAELLSQDKALIQRVIDAEVVPRLVTFLQDTDK